MKESAFIDVSGTNLTAGSETFRMAFGLMNNTAAAAAKMELDGSGNLQIDGALEIDGNIIRNSTGNDTITMATGSTGLVTLSGDLRVNGNQIQNSDGDSVISFDVNDEVEFLSAIQIKGNLIRNSTGNDTITMGTGATGLVTSSGNLQVGGNEIKSSGGTTAITLNGANISSTGHATFANIDIGSSVAGQQRQVERPSVQSRRPFGSAVARWLL
jgi:hypothetical protein